ncbi:MAG TPA: hypothetical protein VF595_13005 [Tepidisphaeraceae bacterium]
MTPVTVRLAFRDGTCRNALLIAQSQSIDARPTPDLRFRTATGEVALRTDMLVSITDIVDKSSAEQSSALIRVERGSPRRLKFGRQLESIVILNDDGTRELVDLRKIASLRVVRKTAVARS